VQVRRIAIHPAEQNDLGASTAALRILCGLRALARAIQVSIDLEPLRDINKGRFWLAGMTLLAAPPNCDDR